MEAHQQYQYQYQQQQQQPSTEQQQQSQTTYDPSQYQQQQSYDQSSYYYQQQQDYATYYYQQQQQQQQYQDYSSSYQTTDPNAIHPPGVPLTVDSQQTLVSNPQNLYYPHAVIASQPTSHHGYLPAGGPQAGQPVRGRGTSGRGRGRGGGRGKPQSARSAPGAAQPSRMAWCEVCRTNCTTFEVLEQHKNGKRHKKNLKVQAELMGLGRQMAVTNPETVPPQNADVSNGVNPSNDNIAPESASSENKTDKPEVAGPLPSQESVFAGRGGFKRKMRGGRGGGRGAKRMRADGSRRPVDPQKPKQVFPLICELCNVKCESQVVFETHLAGKKHMTTVKRFEGHKEVLGEGIQALYPSISHLIPSGSFISQANQQHGPQDAQALASMILSQQNLQDPQAAHAALTQLLQQHGIHDAQTLIAQLVPYLVTQLQAPGSLPTQAAGSEIPAQAAGSEIPAQAPGSEIPAQAAGSEIPAQAAGSEIPAQNLVSQEGAPNLTGSESLNVAAENETEQQAVTTTVDSEVNPNPSMDDKTDNVAPENESQP